MALKPGTKLTSMFNANIEIVNLLGSGGQGYVYKILYNGAPKALRIYKPSALKDPQAFYNNVKENIQRGSPSPSFLWPTDLLKWNGKTFGYIMDLRPSEYEELSAFMAGSVYFASFKVAVSAALQIIAAFRILHNQGYSYQDLNDGNFFINPKTGDVLICDNDNVAQNGKNTGILGKPRYMAPEIVRHETMPNTQTDRFSLSVILFIMLTMTHPLEGKRYLVPCLTPEIEEQIYGTEPIFLLDPDDKRNAPIAGIHNNIGIVWPVLPQYMKDAFLREFSQEVLKNPGRRSTEANWQSLLIRFRSEIIPCGMCGNEVFTYNAAAPVCDRCKRSLGSFRKIKMAGCDYLMPALPGNIVYRVQLGTANVDQAGNPMMRVRRNPKDPQQIILQNVSGQDVEVTTPSGKIKMVANNAAVPANPGIKIKLQNGSLEIVE